MQIKITIAEFMKSFAPSSRPHSATIRRRCERGDYPAVKEGRNWYILREISTGDQKADEILRKYM